MNTSIYFLSIALVGYLSSRFTGKYKSHFAHIIPLGFGILGLFYFCNILIWNKFNPAGFIVFILIFVLLAVLFLRIKKIKIIAPIEYNTLDLIILGLLFLVALQQIHEYWDAWAIWNTKAKFLTSGSWQQLFSPQIKWMHPDYPLLLPSVVAAGWSISNTYSPVIPFLIALFFSWSIYLLVKDWIAHLFNKNLYGVLGGLLMISLPAFLRWSGSQYADIPLANFILFGTFLLYSSTNSLLVFISGFAFGLAAFTKNEGLLYFILILVSFIYTFITSCFISFFFIYLITPQDVVWHIQTSFNRLLIQIFQLVIVSVFIRLKHLKIKQGIGET